jgi:hypothetical protein
MPKLLSHFKSGETERLAYCLDFLSSSLSDDSKWVRNGAYQHFGAILYSIFQKIDQTAAGAAGLKQKIKEVSDKFYNMDRMEDKNKDKDNSAEDKLIQSFMNTESDDVEIVKQFWAYNLPGVLLVNGGNRDYWCSRLKEIFTHLHKDELAIVRKTLAAGFLDVAKMLNLS